MIGSLQIAERACLQEFASHALKLMAADPRLSLAVARGRAIEALHSTCVTYWETRSRLTAMGFPPITFEEL